MSKSLEDLFAAGFEGMNDLLHAEEQASSYDEDTTPNITRFMLRGMFQMMVKMDAIVEVLVEIRDQEKSPAPGSYTDAARALEIINPMHEEEWNSILAAKNGKSMEDRLMILRNMPIDEVRVNLMSRLKDPNLGRMNVEVESMPNHTREQLEMLFKQKIKEGPIVQACRELDEQAAEKTRYSDDRKSK